MKTPLALLLLTFTLLTYPSTVGASKKVIEIQPSTYVSMSYTVDVNVEIQVQTAGSAVTVSLLDPEGKKISEAVYKQVEIFVPANNTLMLTNSYLIQPITVQIEVTTPAQDFFTGVMAVSIAVFICACCCATLCLCCFCPCCRRTQGQVAMVIVSTVSSSSSSSSSNSNVRSKARDVPMQEFFEGDQEEGYEAFREKYTQLV